MHGKAWDGAFQFTEATSDLQDSAPVGWRVCHPLGLRGGAAVPGEEPLQLCSVGHMGHERAVWVQQRQEHTGSMCAEPINLLACLLGQAAHDLLAAGNPESVAALAAAGTAPGTAHLAHTASQEPDARLRGKP